MITRKSGDKEQEKPSAEASFQFGVQASNDSEMEQAAESFGEAQQSFSLGGDFKRAAESRAMIAAIEGQDGLLEQSVSSYRYAIQLYRDGGRPSEEAESLLAMGHVERQLGHLDQALKAYPMAHRLYQSLHQVQRLGRVALALGHVELQRTHLDYAAQHYQEAIDYLRAAADTTEIDALKSLANVERLLGSFSEAEVHCRLALEKYRLSEDVFGSIDALTDLGRIYLDAGRLDQASIERRMVMTQPSTRILVLGAGIGGLLFTLRLAGKVAREPVQITLVDELDTFTIRPRLHEFATHERVFSRPFLEILRKTQVQFLEARVTSLNPSQHRITIQVEPQQQQELTYDYLVYALGSMTDRHSVPGVAEYAYSLSIRGLFSAAALRETLPELGARGGQVVVCGGGATGIETAAQVASSYPRIKVSLVAEGSLALSWGKSVADIIRRRLVSLDVKIVDQSTVQAVRAQSVVLDQGRELECSLCIWTAGFVVQPLAREAGLPVNERDQILVDPFLRSVSHQEIYAIGDAASPVEDPGVSHVRMSAYTASIMGAHGADCLSAILSGKTPKPLSFAYLAQAIALGQNHGIFLPLSPDDRPIPPYLTGWLGALTRVAAIRFVVTATLAQWRFPGLFVWPGKGRYERAQRHKRALEEHPSRPLHRLS